MVKKELNVKFEIPQGVSLEVTHPIYKFKGEKGEVSLKLNEPDLKIEKKDNNLELSSIKGTKNEKKILFTYRSKIKNAIEGVQNGYLYELKVCSGHFPMNVSVNNNTITVKNFLGEKVPRVCKFIYDDVKVQVQGDKITVEAADKERAGQIAASIELLCRRPGFDRRIFQDGIYITKKAGKEL